MCELCDEVEKVKEQTRALLTLLDTTPCPTTDEDWERAKEIMPALRNHDERPNPGIVVKYMIVNLAGIHQLATDMPISLFLGMIAGECMESEARISELFDALNPTALRPEQMN
jgi:hypothetical protein